MSRLMWLVFSLGISPSLTIGGEFETSCQDEIKVVKNGLAETWKFKADKIKFDKLPGKKGFLKPGFKFDKANYGELAAFDVVKDGESSVEIDLDVKGEKRDGPFVVRIFSFAKPGTADEVKLTVQVNMLTTDGAQEGIVNELMTSNYCPIDGPPIVRGETLGIHVGDFNFVTLGVTSSDIGSLKWFHFVRNNVRVLIESKSAGFDTAEFGRKIDLEIKGQPDMKARELATAFAPSIEILQPAVAEVQTGGKVEILVKTSDPRLQAMDLRFNASVGGVTRKRDVGGTRYFFAPSSGPEAERRPTITLTVVNRSGLSAQQQTTLRVVSAP